MAYYAGSERKQVEDHETNKCQTLELRGQFVASLMPSGWATNGYSSSLKGDDDLLAIGTSTERVAANRSILAQFCVVPALTTT